jgi:membrane fusion protein, multidrug efflux system
LAQPKKTPSQQQLLETDEGSHDALSPIDSIRSLRDNKMRDSQPMIGRSIRFVFWLIIIVGFIFLALTKIAGSETAQRQKPSTVEAMSEDLSTLAMVETIELVPRKMRSFSSYIGHLKPEARVTLSSEIAGTVRQVNFSAGQAVPQHAVILEFDTERLQINKALKQSNYDLSLVEYQREMNLYEKRITTAANLASLKNRLETNRYQLKLADIELKNAVVRAPRAGVINEMTVEAGEYVGVAKKLAEIVIISPILAQINIPESDIRFARLSKTVDVRFDALPERLFSGRVRAISLEADLKTRSYVVDVEISNPKGDLLPGMLARVTMLKIAEENQILIPRHAIQEEENSSFVYIVQQDRSVKRPIEIGLSIGDEVQITSGLSFGDLLVNTGQQFVTDQEPVMVVNIKRQSS